ncbi:hypothetical protein PR003_g6472 [Phytophthora rubi]|uniref:Uncharacterized protein n=1 Tax=Phytophthora rubi TaxID=129364 RepID=A0A6A3NNA5_9STRA|nr:hypothetical protein PR002_g6554 [Phytophthora rubi]KAE9042494.1 hypothetical protein PR001_g6154 [Phytophthora rubi]KAE9348313.1 hypothetical protein PR003_g6472 [Phytophthora rubi]
MSNALCGVQRGPRHIMAALFVVSENLQIGDKTMEVSNTLFHGPWTSPQASSDRDYRSHMPPQLALEALSKSTLPLSGMNPRSPPQTAPAEFTSPLDRLIK